MPKRMVSMRSSGLSALASALLAGAVFLSSAPAAAGPNALHARVLGELRSFTTWLRAGPGAPAQGVIGEVGWPGEVTASGDERWNALARAWYEAASDAGLWVAAWSAGELWSDGYKLLVYGQGPRAKAQAAIVEAQRPRQRGVNVAGAEFGTPVDEAASAFSNAAPGRYGADYAYPSGDYLRALAARGVAFMRLPVRWERLQPLVGGELDPGELERLEGTLAAAKGAGLRVVLDIHNYGAYYLYDPASGRGVRRPIGSPQLPVEAFADLWRRLAERLSGNGAILAYGLMNEPVGLAGPRAWERASRAAARAIRAAGERTPILVQSYHWGGARQFAVHHPGGPWVDAPRVWYEAHHYFDSDRSARYLASYDRELSLARRR